MSDIQPDEIQRDGRTGLPRKVRGEFPLPPADDANDSVRAFLEANSDSLKLPADEQSLQLIQTVTTPSRRMVRYQQLHQGIPVLDSTVLVQIDSANRVKQIDLGHVPVPVADEAKPDGKLSAKDALKVAQDTLGKYTPRRKVEDPELVYYPTNVGLTLAYLVLVPTREPAHDWRIVVDANTGEILEQQDLIQEVNGQGLVFDPNPVVTANNNTLRDPDATLATCGFTGSSRVTIDAQRVTRTLRDITLSGGLHRLEGPFAKARNFGAPNPALPAEANANNFNYSSGDDRFEAVNAYYHIDTIQRYIQSLGILTANNRQTEYDPHEGSAAAFYSPIDKGLHFSDSGPCRPDRAEDGHVMTHEYGHAIQDNQVPGWGTANPITGRAETRAMGEGFGDALACVFFATFGGGFQREVFEQWIFGDQGGLRRVDGTKVYPTDWAGQEHADGEIWSSALWNIYRAIGGDSLIQAERLAARDALLKTLILSHHRLLANSSMPDGAEAVMDENAELDDFRGKHLIQMLNSFHDRGLLRSNIGVDLYIRDDVSDPGADAFVGPVFWDSPDLWIRHNDDNGTTHQSPEFGQDNWFYARVRNRGTQTARAFVVTFNVKPWMGVQFTYPNDFIPYVSAAVGYNLAPGASTVVKAKWPAGLIPAPGTHVCWLASVYTPVDRPPAGRHVWEHNNLAQKNLTVVDLIPGDSYIMNFQLGSEFLLEPERYRLEVRRPREWVTLPVSLVHPDPSVLRKLIESVRGVEVIRTEPEVESTPFIRFLEPSRVEIAHAGISAMPVRLSLARDSMLDIGEAKSQLPIADFGMSDREAVLVTREGSASINFNAGLLAGFPVALQRRTMVNLGLKVTAPQDAKPGDVVKVHLVQRNAEEQIVGGVTLQINVVEKK